GSHLCDALIEKGNKVFCVDNLLSGSKKNIEHLTENKNFVFLQEDVNFFSFDKKVDEVFHLASLASPVDYFSKPVQTMLSGSVGTKNMLDLALKNKAKFLFTSTSEIYGDPLVHPQKESYWGNVNCVGARSCYDESKRFSEALIKAYEREFNFDGKIVRIFNTFGPRMRLNDGRVVPNFINQALNNKPLTVYGSGKQTRSFCFVSDMVEGILKTMKSDFNGPVNLGNPEEYSILEFAEKIMELKGKKLELKFFPALKDDPKQRKPDISLALEKLGWKPKFSLDKGLKITMDYFKNL
ncbi:SDR family oxidoreductase, partial [Candidatus Micrarchaeota archaeon]|nr:SDR family oxidoreductase [Candidatus Micrarchaeota archaeon]